MPARKIVANFIEPMLLMRTDKLPEGDDWVYEIKLDGYRCLVLAQREMEKRRSPLV